MAVAQKGKQASQALSPAIENLNVKKRKIACGMYRRKAAQLKSLGGVFNDRLTEPELFCERPNNSLPLQAVLQSAEEALSHDRHFVLKSGSSALSVQG